MKRDANGKAKAKLLVLATLGTWMRAMPDGARATDGVASPSRHLYAFAMISRSVISMWSRSSVTRS